MMRPDKFRALLLLFLTFAILAHGSEGALASHPGTDEYFLELLETKNTSIEDGVTIVLYLLKQPEYRRPWKEKVLALKREGIVPESFSFERDWPLRRGFMAYMLMNALKVRTNLMIRSGGMSSRYSHRELASLGIMVGGSDRKRISGPELLGIYLRAKEFMKKGKVETV